MKLAENEEMLEFLNNELKAIYDRLDQITNPALDEAVRKVLKRIPYCLTEEDSLHAGYYLDGLCSAAWIYLDTLRNPYPLSPASCLTGECSVAVMQKRVEQDELILLVSGIGTRFLEKMGVVEEES